MESRVPEQMLQEVEQHPGCDVAFKILNEPDAADRD